MSWSSREGEGVMEEPVAGLELAVLGYVTISNSLNPTYDSYFGTLHFFLFLSMSIPLVRVGEVHIV